MNFDIIIRQNTNSHFKVVIDEDDYQISYNPNTDEIVFFASIRRQARYKGIPTVEPDIRANVFSAREDYIGSVTTVHDALFWQYGFLTVCGRIPNIRKNIESYYIRPRLFSVTNQTVTIYLNLEFHPTDSYIDLANKYRLYNPPQNLAYIPGSGQPVNYNRRRFNMYIPEDMNNDYTRTPHSWNFCKYESFCEAADRCNHGQFCYRG